MFGRETTGDSRRSTRCGGTGVETDGGAGGGVTRTAFGAGGAPELPPGLAGGAGGAGAGDLFTLARDSGSWTIRGASPTKRSVPPRSAGESGARRGGAAGGVGLTGTLPPATLIPLGARKSCAARDSSGSLWGFEMYCTFCPGASVVMTCGAPVTMPVTVFVITPWERLRGVDPSLSFGASGTQPIRPFVRSQYTAPGCQERK